MTTSVAPSSSEDMRSSIIVAVLLASSTARAEGDDKSPALATGASVGVTVGALVGSIGLASQGKGGAGLYLMSGGLLLGPSVGHWYAGSVGVTGLVLRGAGFGLMAATVADAFDCDSNDGTRNCSAAEGGFILGFGALVAGVLYDFATVGDSARRANRRTITLAPAMVAGPRGNAPGLGFSGAF